MPPRLRLFYALLTAALVLIPAIALYGELSRRSDIWWTPAAMALSLDDSKDRVVVYVHQRPLRTLIDQQQLSMNEGAESRAVSADDIRLRFNNWDRIRVARLPLLLAYAAACGGGIVLILLIASGRLVYRDPFQTGSRT